jgi:hypothetical protein
LRFLTKPTTLQRHPGSTSSGISLLAWTLLCSCDESNGPIGFGTLIEIKFKSLWAYPGGSAMTGGLSRPSLTAKMPVSVPHLCYDPVENSLHLASRAARRSKELDSVGV